MSSTFPVIHSILDAQALSGYVGKRYGLTPVSCQLISRGSNDIYHLRTSDTGYAVRVQRAGWRNDEDVGYELALVRHLAQHGQPVVPALADTRGDYSFRLNAPEGSRSVTVSPWLDGKALTAAMDESTAKCVGELTAKIHVAGQSFEPDYIRRVDTSEKILVHREALARLLAHRPEDAGYFGGALDWMAMRVSGLPGDLPMTHTHGDVHFGNVFRHRTGTALLLLDFDDCGYDIALKDLMGFLWRNRTEQLAPGLAEQFVAGYESVRTITQQEHHCFPILLAARYLYLLATLAGTINRMGPVPGFSSSIDLYLSLTREHLAAAGYQR